MKTNWTPELEEIRPAEPVPPIERKSYWYPNLKRLKVGGSFKIAANKRGKRTNVYQIARNLGIKVTVRTVKGVSYVWRIE